MEAWRKKLDKYLNGQLKLFEEDYKITYPCVLKKGKKRIKARIDIKNGVVYNLKGKQICKCKGTEEA